MNLEELQQLFCTKIGMELAGYKKKMLKKEPEFIFSRAYQIDCIVHIYENLIEMSRTMRSEVLQILLTIPDCLMFLYRSWNKREDSLQDELVECLNDSIMELYGKYKIFLNKEQEANAA